MMPAVVPVGWLARHLDDPDLVILDVRVGLTADGPRADRDGYLAGHIPGAAFADLHGEFSDTTTHLAFVLATPQAVCAAAGRLGVGDTSRVVLYDTWQHTPAGRIGTVWAARLWWMLRAAGFDEVAVLDGGLSAWTAAGLPTASGEQVYPTRALAPRPRPELIADTAQVRSALGAPGVHLVDALPPEHFRGERRLYARAGHLPGAVNKPVADVFDEAGRFRSPADLALQYADLPPGRVITYCGAGIAASAVALALTLTGRGDVALYAGSLQEWVADPANPLEPNHSAAGGATS